MILYDIFKVLSNDITVLVRDQHKDVIFFGYLHDIHSKYLMCTVIELKPLSVHEIVIYIIER